MKSVKILLVCLVTILGLSTIAYADVPKMINYQGKITRPSGALVDTTTSMVFSIYADSTNGTVLWTETQASVDVQYGIFSVLLGGVNPIPDSVFDGSVRYLGVKVGNDSEMTPRKAIVSVGYAFKTGYSDTAEYARTAPAMPDADWTIDGDNIYRLSGNVGIGTTNPDQKLSVNGILGIYPNVFVMPSTRGLFLYHSGDVANIFAYNYPAVDADPLGLAAKNITLSTYISGNAYERLFVHNNGNVGIGTTSPTQKLQINNGNIQMTSGDLPYSLMGGLRFGTSYDNWDDWAGIEGWSYGGLDQAYLKFYTTYISRSEKMCIMPSGNVGIGTTNPEFRLDVSGDIRATGTIYGNFAGTIDNADKLDGYHNGQVSADIWDGHHWGDTYPYSSNSDLVDGIHGTQFLRNDQSGTLSASVGDYQAVLNVLNSGEGRSIYASTNASMNRNAAIYGDALDDGGVGVYGNTSSPGVSGGSSVGVFGLADNTGGSVGGAAIGVFGRVYSYQNYPNSVPVGVFGEAMHSTGVAWGVAGESHSTSPSASGVKGTLKTTGAQGRAIWGEAPTTGWAGYFSGNVHVTGNLSCSGSKPAVLDDFSDGKKRYIYSQESPEIWFEDFGEAELRNGKAHIEVDPLFLETVTIDKDHPMKVFVTLNDECNGVYVKRGNAGFDVIEFNNGKSNAHFTYRMVAKRKGFEDKRLEIFEYEFTEK